ncbi:hypothetical protein [Variovorax soli]|uniref:hypothetical protein n=1 Tax=Variovorax soli TaxID=376815 RepID=UPI00083848F4|nr:hypothetical protein [Variovorax soli]
MTILNLCAEPLRVVVATDTAVSREGQRGNVDVARKVRVFPERRLAVASRGAIKSLDALEAYVKQSPTRDFDSLINLPHLTFPPLLCRSMPIGTDAANRWQVAIAGWSAEHERMLAAVFEVDRKQCFPKKANSGAGGARVMPLPPIDHPELLAEPFSRDAMLLTMRRQLQAAQDDDLEGGFGGDMIYVTITADGVIEDEPTQL